MWQPLATLTLTTEWQYTPVTDALWFRLRHSQGVGFARGHFGQAYIAAGNVDLLNVFSIFPSQEGEIFKLIPIPHPDYHERQLALRLTQRSANLPNPWTITLDFMPISQSEQSTVIFPSSDTVTEVVIPASTTPISILSANANRKGFSVLNTSNGILYLKMTAYTANANNAQAVAESSIRLTANALYECPVPYTGAVFGVFASSNGNARIAEYT